MTTLTASRPTVNSAPTLGTADAWPDWTDEGTYELGPDPADAQWWAEQNTDWHDDESGPDYDAEMDRRAEESAAMDRLERGLCC